MQNILNLVGFLRSFFVFSLNRQKSSWWLYRWVVWSLATEDDPPASIAIARSLAVVETFSTRSPSRLTWFKPLPYQHGQPTWALCECMNTRTQSVEGNEWPQHLQALCTWRVWFWACFSFLQRWTLGACITDYWYTRSVVSQTIFKGTNGTKFLQVLLGIIAHTASSQWNKGPLGCSL